MVMHLKAYFFGGVTKALSEPPPPSMTNVNLFFETIPKNQTDWKNEYWMIFQGVNPFLEVGGSRGKGKGGKPHMGVDPLYGIPLKQILLHIILKL